jgi:TPR repeat protein
VQQNTQEAMRLFRIAAAAGSRTAKEWLRRLATHYTNRLNA